MESHTPLHTNWGRWRATSCSCVAPLHVLMNVNPGAGGCCFQVCMWPWVPMPLACKWGWVMHSFLIPHVCMLPQHANWREGAPLPGLHVAPGSHAPFACKQSQGDGVKDVPLPIPTCLPFMCHPAPKPVGMGGRCHF